MKYLRSFNENVKYSIFNSNGWKKFLPKELSVITDNGNWQLHLPSDDNNMGHATNITNIMNVIQISYYQNTPSKGNGDVTSDGEPDLLCFDITIVKKNDGTKSNPDTLKLSVDITYGDNMVSEFTIEKPNKINLIHYNSYGSLYDPQTFFAFDDNSLIDLIKFFNSWGFNLTKDDLKFLDKYPNSYYHDNMNK